MHLDESKKTLIWMTERGWKELSEITPEDMRARIMWRMQKDLEHIATITSKYDPVEKEVPDAP